MNKIACKILAIVFLFILATSLLITPAGSESFGEEGGSVECSTNLQLIPQADQVGGGHISWTIEGEAAREMRQLLIDSIDNETFFDEADGDGTLNEEELEIFLGQSNMLESYIQRGGTLSSFRGSLNLFGFEPVRDIDPDDHINYFGAEIERSSLTSDNIADDTQGLLGSTADDSSSIKIDFTIRFHESPGKGGPHKLDMSETRVLKGVWESLIIPVRKELITEAGVSPQTEFDIEHENLLSDETGDSGSYGRVLRNEMPMDPDNYTIDPEEGRVSIAEDSINQNDNISLVYAYSPVWEGDSESRHWSYVVGTNNFYEPDHDGSLYILRTPAGEVIYYSNNFQASNPPDESISWVEFEPLMNPQILFVIVAVFSYFTAAMPKKYFKDYRLEYPAKYRDRAEKSRFLHLITKLSIVSLLILYFFPVIGPFFVKGLYLMIMSPALMVGSVILSKLVYGRKKAAIPEDIKNPPEKKTVKKRAAEKPDRDVKKGKCRRCGEVFTVPKERNLLTVNCPVCGKRQRQLKEGYNYLLMDEDSDNTYSIYDDFIKEGLDGLIITTDIPSKVEEKYGVYNQEIQWITESASENYEVLDPKRMDFEITKTVSNFAKEHDRAVLLLEGIEYLVVENEFVEVSKFIKKVTDITSMNATTLLVHVNPEAFETYQINTLKKNFDNTEDLRYKKNNKEKKTY
ncbi:MAG: DUF835 domain-containing protein [Candidatus Saliniplasma sp.]